MTIESASQSLVAEFRSRRTLRTGSLITTIFGDSIAPRGGTVWLGSLIAVMQDFGIGERLVRTSVFRLVQDGWLGAKQIGRRSYYSLTDEGRERFEHATHKIYGEPVSNWDDTWTTVLLTNVEGATKDSVRKELGWLGFGALSTTVFAHPSPDMADVDSALRRLGLEDDLVIMSGRTIRNESAMRRLVQDSWNLADIDERYASFVKRFRPLIAAYGKDANVSPKTAFLVRTLLIQEYRKVLLRDPQLPAALLPADWHGNAAYQLCRNLYLAIYAQADAYLSETMETADGPLPPPSGSFMQRFGGLQ
ncbi:MAG: phenylacetic acid degradation operon negative regulatory protein PaaX [Gammaproteobacteria bacterium]|nr:phenylacetic acid degradation operon negative regulatory protein PaaX [Gammaproteobacteria bacterium]MDH3429225.1 phenylacetic acid degradation operon negative regulatory protein PaaX [Gammaproteobacteria bacterium]MDH3434571.1 phenylacetic acid degradation operon negative regulatory protein PaaX [Gammaproteobacteria bacterium]